MPCDRLSAFLALTFRNTYKMILKHFDEVASATAVACTSEQPRRADPNHHELFVRRIHATMRNSGLVTRTVTGM